MGLPPKIRVETTSAFFFVSRSYYLVEVAIEKFILKILVYLIDEMVLES